MTQRQRQKLLGEIEQLVQEALFGTLSESYRCCGNRDCRCHSGGPKHGPHLYISYRGPSGKTTGYYVPQAVEAPVRRGVEAWSRLQERLRELAMANKERLIQPKVRSTRPKTLPLK